MRIIFLTAACIVASMMVDAKHIAQKEKEGANNKSKRNVILVGGDGGDHKIMLDSSSDDVNHKNEHKYRRLTDSKEKRSTSETKKDGRLARGNMDIFFRLFSGSDDFKPASRLNLQTINKMKGKRGDFLKKPETALNGSKAAVTRLTTRSTDRKTKGADDYNNIHKRQIIEYFPLMQINRKSYDNGKYEWRRGMCSASNFNGDLGTKWRPRPSDDEWEMRQDIVEEEILPFHDKRNKFNLDDVFQDETRNLFDDVFSIFKILPFSVFGGETVYVKLSTTDSPKMFTANKTESSRAINLHAYIDNLRNKRQADRRKNFIPAPVKTYHVTNEKPLKALVIGDESSLGDHKTKRDVKKDLVNAEGSDTTTSVGADNGPTHLDPNAVKEKANSTTDGNQTASRGGEELKNGTGMSAEVTTWDGMREASHSSLRGSEQVKEVPDLKIARLKTEEDDAARGVNKGSLIDLMENEVRPYEETKGIAMGFNSPFDNSLPQSAAKAEIPVADDEVASGGSNDADSGNVPSDMNALLMILGVIPAVVGLVIVVGVAVVWLVQKNPSWMGRGSSTSPRNGPDVAAQPQKSCSVQC